MRESTSQRNAMYRLRNSYLLARKLPVNRVSSMHTRTVHKINTVQACIPASRHIASRRRKADQRGGRSSTYRIRYNADAFLARSAPKASRRVASSRASRIASFYVSTRQAVSRLGHTTVHRKSWFGSSLYSNRTSIIILDTYHATTLPTSARWCAAGCRLTDYHISALYARVYSSLRKLSPHFADS